MRNRNWLIAAVTLFCMAAPASAACNFTPEASLPLYPESTGRFTVPLSLNGQTFRFVVDTGANHHTMAAAVADLLGLVRNKVPGKPEKMLGGAPLGEHVSVPDIAFGPLKAPQMEMYILPDERLHNTDGLLASDLWTHFDVELDYAAGRLSLYTPCTGRSTTWGKANGAIAIPFTLKSDHILIAGKFDSKPVDIVVDTGASETAIDISQLPYFGLRQDSPGVRDMGKGVWYRYTFENLEIGPLTLPKAEVAFVNLGPKTVWVGSDVLRRYRVLISYTDKSLVLANASEDPAAAAALEIFNAAYTANEHHEDEKARDLYAQALASPTLPATYRSAGYLGRSQVQFRLKQCAAARDDFNKAAALDRNLLEAHHRHPNSYITALDKSCPEAVTIQIGPPR